jgi:phosphatidylinositol-3-phosphatase
MGLNQLLKARIHFSFMKSSFSSFVIKAALSVTAFASILNVHPLRAQQVQTVWFIYFENRNWTQTTSSGGAQSGASLQQILGSANAPYINSLVTPGNANAAMVSYCSRYHHVLSGPTAPIQPSQAWTFSSLSVHPSEPNYVWQEAGLNLSKYDDNDPYGSGNSVQQIANYYAANPSVSTQHLTGLLQAAGISWKTYQEGTDLLTTSGNNVNVTPGTITNTVAPTSQWSVPLQSFSGNNSAYTNPYNGSHQWNFACKHCGPLFFTDTNGSTTTTANFANSNPETFNYAPLEQLQNDLNNGTCAQYNIITPDQFNDMHTALSGTFTSPETGLKYTGDSAQLAQGDNFCSIIVPRIMASPQFKNNGCIVLWTDETEPTGATNDTSSQNDFNHTLMEIVISPLAKGNAYNSTFNYTHSSDIATMQELFNVFTGTGSGLLNDAANPSNANASGASGVARDLTDLFVPGAIQSVTAQSEPAMPVWMLGFMGVLLAAAAIHVLPMPRAQRS